VKQTLEPRCIIQENAKRIRELHGKVHSTLRGLAYGTSTVAEQKQAAVVFKAGYDELAFPGGFDAGVRRIEEADCETIEYALAFLEVRPYFFRSQYMRKKLIRLLKHVSLTPRQVTRLERVLEFEQSKKVKKTYG
jgi:hypothetical protein